MVDGLEEQGMETVSQRHLGRKGTDLDLVEQLNIYEVGYANDTYLFTNITKMGSFREQKLSRFSWPDHTWQFSPPAFNVTNVANTAFTVVLSVLTSALGSASCFSSLTSHASSGAASGRRFLHSLQPNISWAQETVRPRPEMLFYCKSVWRKTRFKHWNLNNLAAVAGFWTWLSGFGLIQMNALKHQKWL